MIIIDKASMINYSFFVILIYLFLCLFTKPIKIIAKLLINSIFGLVLILVTNFFGKFSGIYIGLNPVTALVAGAMGIPGIILMIIINFMT